MGQRETEVQQMVKRNRKTERNKEIVAYRKAGIPYRLIAEHFKISIIRVRQVCEVWEGREC